MHLRFLFLLLLFSCFTLDAAAEKYPKNPYQAHFDQAYQQNPNLPEGVLEAIAWKMTRFQHLDNSIKESCHGLPRNYGVMGLTRNGKSYFRENLQLVAQHSSFTETELMQSPQKNILGYAEAYSYLQQQLGISSQKIENHLPVLMALMELPMDSSAGNDYAMNLRLYDILNTLNDPAFQNSYGLPVIKLNLEDIFGANNLKIISSGTVFMDDEGIHNEQGTQFQTGFLRAPDYPPAVWDPAPSCNYSSRNGTAISAVTVHTMQGTYSGAISWAQNCNSNVSFHYAVRSSDGHSTQLVYEADKGWHVGSENPYTIGIEHEGYINDPSYLTADLYGRSADIVRDITNSGYGIDPLRTHDGPACSGSTSSCLLGGCTKIKGHQHFPNQTHTDPGPYYDWERYYRLINPNPPVTQFTSSTGVFYDSGGPTGNYGDDERMLYLIEPTNASSVTLTVNEFGIEDGWDSLYVYDGDTIAAPLIGGYSGGSIPSTITSTGGSLLVEFRSDCATDSLGWEFEWEGLMPDSVSPTTSIDTVTDWVTQDKDITFSDADNTGGSGLEKSFYQIIDFDGQEWRANQGNGFFSDNFDQGILHQDWVQDTGTWQENSGYLEQTDESIGNTNIYAPLDQTHSNRYLYHWTANISGSGTNKRAGLHFFCDQPALENRGNSYFIWFREDDDAIQLYKVTNNSWGSGPVKQTSYSFNTGQWYDFKLTYDRIEGGVKVYVDNELVLAWTDNSPHSSGSHISFRSGNANYKVNKLKVYRSRYPTITATVGPGSSNDIRYQNQNPSTYAAKVKSIVQDSAGNLSTVDQLPLNVDWSAPTLVAVNDGTGSDIDTTNNGTELSANWTTSQDTNSNIAAYWYAIGTNPGDSNVVGWTNNNMNTSVTHTGLSLTAGQTYYFTVKPENGAGLKNGGNPSNGQTYVLTTDVKTQEPSLSILKAYPQPFTDGTTVEYILPGSGKTSITVFNGAGKIVMDKEQPLPPGRHLLRLGHELAQGYYLLRIQYEDQVREVKLVKERK